MKKLMTSLAVLLCFILITYAQHKAPTNVGALDNAIYIESAVISPGTQQVLSVRMKNTVPVAGYEFSVLFPEGVTVATDDDGFNLVELSTERTTANRMNFFDSSLQVDGTLKVLCGTNRKDPNTGLPYAFTGNDGEVARITVNVAAGLSAGQYPVVVKNAVIASPDASKTTIETDVESILEVNGLLLGDANGDGRVTIADVVAVVNNILGNASNDFVFDAANVNGDEGITIADALGIVNIILTPAP